MSLSVFWSWQSDRPASLNKEFVKQALARAIDDIAADLVLSPAERPELDHDTKGEPGMVEIVNTILRKIEACSVFVADVTPVARTDQGKHVPNPNVMIELGHALSVLGPGPIIAVTNLAFGGGPQDLPFDLRHRRGAISYKLSKTDDETRRKEVLAALSTDLADALRLDLAAAIKAVDASAKFLQTEPPENDSSIWLAQGVAIEYGDWFGGAEQRSVLPSGRTRSYFRASPSGWHGKPPLRREVHGATADLRLWPLGRWRDGDGGPNKLGTVNFAVSRTEGTTRTATQWFDKTGEIWAFDSSICDEVDGKTILGHYQVVRDWDSMIERAIAFYQHFKAKAPFQVEVGLAGLSAVYWADPMVSRRTPALEDSVAHAIASRDWSTTGRHDFLLDAYNKLCDAFHQPPIDRNALIHILRR